MSYELDTLLIAPYVYLDDHVIPARAGRGRRPRLSDAELVCLAVAQRLLDMTAGLWSNWAVGALDKRSLTAYDH